MQQGGVAVFGMLHLCVAGCKHIHTNSLEFILDKRFAGALSITQAMEYLGDIGRTKMYQIINRGDIEVTHIDSKPVILLEELNRFLAGLQDKGND